MTNTNNNCIETNFNLKKNYIFNYCVGSKLLITSHFTFYYVFEALNFNTYSHNLGLVLDFAKPAYHLLFHHQRNVSRTPQASIAQFY